MAKFSLIQISKTHDDGKVEGYWLQDHIGTLHSAIGVAVKTSMANSGLHIGVVEQVRSTVPALNHWKNLKRLDDES